MKIKVAKEIPVELLRNARKKIKIIRFNIWFVLWLLLISWGMASMIAFSLF